MGNGAPVRGKGESSAQVIFERQQQFRQIELMCRNDHFQQHFQEYTTIFQRAVKNDALDIVEILLSAGNAKKLQPLHIACKYGKIESAELLLSAGFSLFLKDERGRVALHLCSLKNTQEAGLCATLLALQGGKRLVNTTDNLGHSVLHLAAQQDNTHVIQALFNIGGVDMKLKNNSGKTALDVARENESHMAEQLLAQLSTRSSDATRDAYLLLEAAPGRLKEREVDMDRIMQVWERFFENAFSVNGIEFDDTATAAAANSNISSSSKAAPVRLPATSRGHSQQQQQRSLSTVNVDDDMLRKQLLSVAIDEPEYGYNPSPVRGKHKQQQPQKQQSKTAKEYSRKYTDIDYKNDEHCWSRDQRSNADIDIDIGYGVIVSTEPVAGVYSKRKYYEEVVNVSADAEVLVATDVEEKAFQDLDYDTANHMIAWLDWVVCYDYSLDSDNSSSTSAYYVINKYTKESRWLTALIDEFQRSTLLPTTRWDDYDFNMSLPLPTTLFDLVCRGWMTYYEVSENRSVWINVPTYSIETSLPLGIGESSDTLQAFNLPKHGSSITGAAVAAAVDDERSLLWYTADPICSTSWVLVVRRQQQELYLTTAADSKYEVVVDSNHNDDTKTVQTAGNKKDDDYDDSGPLQQTAVAISRQGSVDSVADDPWMSSRTDGPIAAFTSTATAITSSTAAAKRASSISGKSKSVDAKNSISAKSQPIDTTSATFATAAAAADIQMEVSAGWDNIDEADTDVDVAVGAESDVSYYYQHRITDETSWDPPVGWDELIDKHWSGWTLCCDEDYPEALYWHDFDTGESAWVEPSSGY